MSVTLSGGITMNGNSYVTPRRPYRAYVSNFQVPLAYSEDL
jgi:hypothetical protein